LIARFWLFAGRHIDVPSAFFGGMKSDWAVYLMSGAVDVMGDSRVATRMQGNYGTA